MSRKDKDLMSSCVWNLKEPDSQRQSRMKLEDSGGEDQGTQDMRLSVAQSKFKGPRVDHSGHS